MNRFVLAQKKKKSWDFCIYRKQKSMVGGGGLQGGTAGRDNHKGEAPVLHTLRHLSYCLLGEGGPQALLQERETQTELYCSHLGKGHYIFCSGT